MAKTAKKSNYSDYIFVETIHRGCIQWFWTQERLHDWDYRIKVVEAIRGKVSSVEKKYNVENDPRFNTQFEGVLIIGNNTKNIQMALIEIAAYLNRFKGVVILQSDEPEAGNEESVEPVNMGVFIPIW